jgi:chromate reductase
MNEKIQVIGFAGSLRKNSYNKMLLRTVQKLFPSDMEMEIIELPDIPIYNYDIQASQGFPQSIIEIDEKIKNSDAVLFATPEYNYGIPGGLKNFIDWLSRLESKPFFGKPMSMLGATTGMGGTIRAQANLRTVALFIETNVMPKPEIYVTKAANKFDTEGNLTDEATIKILQKYIERFKKWILIFKKQ